MSTKKPSAKKNPPKREKYQGFVRNDIVIVIAVVCVGAGFFLNALVGDFVLRPGNRRLALTPVANNSFEQSVSSEIMDEIEELEEQASENPDDADAWTQLGNAYFDSDQFQMAIQAYRNSLDLEPENPNVWTDLGIMYRRSGDADMAIVCFDNASELDPTHIMSRYNKGVVFLHDIRDEKAAVEAWKEVLQIDPNYVSPTGIRVKAMVENLQ